MSILLLTLALDLLTPNAHDAWNAAWWDGVVWLGVVWQRVLSCGAVWHGVAWRGAVWHGVAWRCAAWRGMAWHGVAWRVWRGVMRGVVVVTCCGGVLWWRVAELGGAAGARKGWAGDGGGARTAGEVLSCRVVSCGVGL